MKSEIAALAFAIVSAISANAQATAQAPAPLPTVAVYPFGGAHEALAVNGAVAQLLALRSVDAISGSKAYTALNKSADPTIGQLVAGAQTLTQFESAIQIKTDQHLQAKYMLSGFVQSATVTSEVLKNKKTNYHVTLNITLELFSVESGAELAAKEISIDNSLVGSMVDQSERCDKLGLFERAKCETKKKMSAGTGGDETKESAVESATRHLGPAIVTLLNENAK